MKVSGFLALKYLKPKRSVASVITVVSILGVALGIAAVIIVRSVMTGFGDIWEEKILDFKPHVTVLPAGGNVIHGEDALADGIREISGVSCVTPEIDTRVMLAHGGRVLAPVMLGVDGDEFRRAYRLGHPVAGSFDLDGDTVVLGTHVARQLGVTVGDEVVVYSPKSLVAEDEVYLPIKWRVGGIFSSGQYEYDSGYCVASLANMRDLMGMDHGVFAIHVKTEEPTNAKRFDAITSAIQALGGGRVRLMDWKAADREIFNALAVEKNMTAVLMLLISLVALFCVMNTLLVLTVQKTPEIGLLKALGFCRREIVAVFMKHGLIQCTIGIVLGLLSAWAVLSNLQHVVDHLAHLGIEVFPASVYGLDEIPHRLVVTDVIWSVLFVYAFGFLASLVPALIAAAKDPVRALEE